jgi:hypothetical protein
MPDAPLPPPMVIDRDVSIARLHGLACFHCGSVAGPLRAAGRVVVRGATRVWPIVTCGCRRGQREIPAEGSPRRPRDRSRGVADWEGVDVMHGTARPPYGVIR